MLKTNSRPVDYEQVATTVDHNNATMRRALLGHLVKVATLQQRDEVCRDLRGHEVYRGYIADHEIRNILDALQAFK